MSTEPDNIRQTIYSILNVDGLNSLKHPNNRELSNANYIGFYIVWRTNNLTLRGIGQHFDNRDHSTVLRGLNMINESMVGYNQELRSKLIKVLDHYKLDFKPYKKVRYEQIHKRLN